MNDTEPLQVRLNRFLAQCGVASRRAAESWIAQGRVQVNDEVARSPAIKIRPDRDMVRVDGRAVTPDGEERSWMMHKPAGTTVTRRDPHAEFTIYDLLPPDAPTNLKPVGRLDRETTGLLLLSSDGDLNFRVTHPRYGVEKEYWAFGPREPTARQMKRLIEGVELEDGLARAESAAPIALESCSLPEPPPACARRGLRLVMHQGRKRVVRRLCQAVGFELARLHRWRVGDLTLQELPSAHCRPLTASEVQSLFRVAGPPQAQSSIR